MSKAIRFPEGAIADGRVGTARIREEIACAASRLKANDMPKLDRPIKALLKRPVGPKKSPKYGNQKCESAGIKFDSKREMMRWNTLLTQQGAGEISELERQVVFILAPAAVLDGRKKPALRFVADFVYMRGEKTVIEDSKGHVTQAYRIKKHLMKTVLGLDITEV